MTPTQELVLFLTYGAVFCALSRLVYKLLFSKTK